MCSGVAALFQVDVAGKKNCGGVKERRKTIMNKYLVSLEYAERELLRFTITNRIRLIESYLDAGVSDGRRLKYQDEVKQLKWLLTKI